MCRMPDMERIPSTEGIVHTGDIIGDDLFFPLYNVPFATSKYAIIRHYPAKKKAFGNPCIKIIGIDTFNFHIFPL